MTWRDTAETHAFLTACFAGAFFALFVKVRVLFLAACFVALRHPAAGKPSTKPYRVAMAGEDR
jgi:hypothetical protein